jgi:hypothetical protein
MHAAIELVAAIILIYETDLAARHRAGTRTRARTA